MQDCDKSRVGQTVIGKMTGDAMWIWVNEAIQEMLQFQEVEFDKEKIISVCIYIIANLRRTWQWHNTKQCYVQKRFWKAKLRASKLWPVSCGLRQQNYKHQGSCSTQCFCEAASGVGEHPLRFNMSTQLGRKRLTYAVTYFHRGHVLNGISEENRKYRLVREVIWAEWDRKDAARRPQFQRPGF